MVVGRVKWLLGRLYSTPCLTRALGCRIQLSHGVEIIISCNPQAPSYATSHFETGSLLEQAAKIAKEYEAKGGDYKNTPGSKNKAKKGPPENKPTGSDKSESSKIGSG